MGSDLRAFVGDWRRRLYVLAAAVLAVSGLSQMPIFKRYYVADIPGLGWLADYYFTHKLHYLAAAVFLLLVFWLATQWLRQADRPALSGLAWARALVVAGLVGTGVVRTLKNLPDFSFSPAVVMVVDWTHLGFAMLLGGVGIAALVRGKGRRA